MAIINDLDELPGVITWSHTWANQIDKPQTHQENCLNFCIKAFGLGVKGGDGESVRYLKSDPRFYLPTRLCEVAIEGDTVGVSFILRPDDAVAADHDLVMRRVVRLDERYPKLLFGLSESSIVHVFRPIGRVMRIPR